MKVNDLKNSIVRIEAEYYNSEEERIFSSGTGFFIEKDKILTCYHIIENHEKEENVKEEDIKVFLNNQVTSYQVKVLYTNIKDDLAVLQIESENQYFVKTDERVINGDDCYCHGFPKIDDEKNEKLKEIIDRPLTLKVEGTDRNYKIIQFKEGQVKSGFSGSPILNLSTHAVCGMICISRNTSNTLGGYGIPISKLKLLKEKNKNEITEPITLKNGKTFDIELVKVELEDKTLYVGKYPVTFEDYDLFCEQMNINKPKDRWGRKEHPVININWKEARSYCDWLSKNSDLTFDLPFSSDWLNIANKNIVYKFLNKYNIHFNKKKKTSNVKIGGEGDLGICHMYGNIYELCLDEIKKNCTIALGGSYRTTNINKFLREEVKHSKSYDTVGFRIFVIL